MVLKGSGYGGMLTESTRSGVVGGGKQKQQQTDVERGSTQFSSRVAAAVAVSLLLFVALAAVGEQTGSDV